MNDCRRVLNIINVSVFKGGMKQRAPDIIHSTLLMWNVTLLMNIHIDFVRDVVPLAVQYHCGFDLNFWTQGYCH